MPQLKSGRHVGLSINPYLAVLTAGSDEQRYFAVVALRFNVATPEDLLAHLVVAYFDSSAGTPPAAPTYNSGYCVADILEGRADWTPAEVEEFRAFVTVDPRFGPWLQQRFDDLDRAIQENHVWDSELLENDVTSDVVDAPLIKRAIIRKSALEPTAMQQLRACSRAA
jgi:hypothetical protein